MSVIDLIYIHEVCPKCGEKNIPLMAWISPCDYDEDGHANAIEVSQIDCSICGSLGEESNEICEIIIDKIYNSNNVVEIGTIYSYFPNRT